MKWTVMFVKHRMRIVEADSYASAVGKAIGYALDWSIIEGGKEINNTREDWSVEGVSLLPETT
jgi:hypothetical protein